MRFLQKEKFCFQLIKLRKNKQNQQNTTDRNYLVAAARDGDENAIENLTLEDIDTYSMLSRRITHEDVLSIVDSYLCHMALRVISMQFWAKY